MAGQKNEDCYFDGYSGNISLNYTFNFNIHDACLILRRFLDYFIRGRKKLTSILAAQGLSCFLISRKIEYRFSKENN